jgi:uncharacterized protein (DUF2141 family)
MTIDLPQRFRGKIMKKRIKLILLALALIALLPTLSQARGTRYVINWPEGYVGPVYVQVYDIRCTFPYELLDEFKVWVTWDCMTKCYKIGNRGTYLLSFYKDKNCKGPMVISGNASSFRIRYSMAPPWI